MPAVTFDVWHTLLFLPRDEVRVYQRARRATAIECLRSVLPARRRAAVPSKQLGSAFDRSLAAANTASTAGRSIPLAAQFRTAARRVGGRPWPTEFLGRWDSLVVGARFASVPDAVETLARLRADGYRVGVVSNTVGESGRALRQVLDRLGFRGLIDAYAFSDEHPWAKPAPELFRWALRALGEPPGRAVHVGDSWSDVEGARRAGMGGSIWFTGSPDRPRPRAPVSRGKDPRDEPRRLAALSEVPAVVPELLSRKRR